MFVFQTLDEVREQTELWLKEYNEERPHESLGDMTPLNFLIRTDLDHSDLAITHMSLIVWVPLVRNERICGPALKKIWPSVGI